MKKIILLTLSLLSLGLAYPAFAQTDSTSVSTALPELKLAEVTTKIRKKDDFYLFIGRTDNIEAQLALKLLTEQAPQAKRPIYFLNLKGIDSKKYKAFSKKYSIRSHAYLARFANKQQVAVFHNNWLEENPDSLAFLLTP